ncbi:MAG: VOC family protein [Carnobacterium inhibens]|jgi:glyoxylase I family protein|uniref:VOC family protein n=1 Tax=Carnobacterium inhibens TaxID=147709 RepID=A0ABR7T9M3_9LACT|nr:MULTISPECIES: VOC family protein [Carnobacterium]MBC9824302.1 VOC family protein [Carnobacterium inhibens]MCM3511622.1 VOC family protein [Carnobacterium inhibens]MDN5371270.1 glyoxylase family protein [Carnobacterium sp.]
MNIKKIHHVAIIASDYQKSKQFYAEVLGLEIIRENYRSERDSYKLDLKLGDSEIELFSFPEPSKRPTQPEAVGLRHLCFYVDNFDETIQELNQKGIETEPVRVDEYTGGRFTFFRDPDDLPLELHE